MALLSFSSCCSSTVAAIVSPSLAQTSRDRAVAKKGLSIVTNIKTMISQGQDQEGSSSLSGPGRSDLLSHMILGNPPETTE